MRLDDELFTVGRAIFQDAMTGEGEDAKIYVKIGLNDVEPILALLDTRATWSVLDRDYAEEIGLLNTEGHKLKLSTRHGLFEGKVVRTPVRLLADEGKSLEVDATVFVSANWTHGNFLGYSGLLERVRFAIDPERNHFYFGPGPS